MVLRYNVRMANENDKINEAEYFYMQMLNAGEEVVLFKHNLSAFLSSSRTVLQFALEDAKRKSGGQDWYVKTVSKYPVIKFFGDERNANIHKEPVHVSKDVHIQLCSTLSVTVHIGVMVKDTDGKIKGSFESKSDSASKDKWVPPIVSYKYRFDKWIGTEDVSELCKQYIDVLKVVVNDGQTKRYLS